jgi:hypothetical protein
MKQMSTEIHKRVVKKIKRRQVITNGPNDVWAIDLVDMGEWKDDNDGMPFMLNVIDAFTRYAWSVPLQDKSAETVTSAFKKILEDNEESPKRLWADQGKEFYNKKFQALLKKHKTELYSTYSEFKASPVERFNRTLKTLMWKRFTEENTRRWVDMLDDLMTEYNNRKHSTIKMTPLEATQLSPKKTKELMAKLYKNPYSDKKFQKKKPVYKVGDWVRVSRQKGVFEKGYHANWSQEIFQIDGISGNFPFVYYLKDYNKEPIEGSFYEEEIQKTKFPDVFLVEKVLKERVKKGKKELFVKFVGWSDKWNQWIPDDETVDV